MYLHDFVKYNYCNELFCTEKSINRKQIVNEANHTYNHEKQLTAGQPQIVWEKSPPPRGNLLFAL